MVGINEPNQRLSNPNLQHLQVHHRVVHVVSRTYSMEENLHIITLDQRVKLHLLVAQIEQEVIDVLLVEGNSLHYSIIIYPQVDHPP